MFKCCPSHKQWTCGASKLPGFKLKKQFWVHGIRPTENTQWYTIKVYWFEYRWVQLCWRCKHSGRQEFDKSRSSVIPHRGRSWTIWLWCFILHHRSRSIPLEGRGQKRQGYHHSQLWWRSVTHQEDLGRVQRVSRSLRHCGHHQIRGIACLLPRRVLATHLEWANHGEKSKLQLWNQEPRFIFKGRHPFEP